MKISPIYKRDLSSELEDKIASLLSEYFHTKITDLWKLRFNLIWHSNPYLTDDIPAGWILINDDDEICGFMGNVPAEFQYGNTTLKASGTGPLYVAQKYSGIESSRLCLSFIKQKTEILISSTPNDTAVKIFTKLKLNKIPVESITSYIIVIAPFSFLKYLLVTYALNNGHDTATASSTKSRTIENESRMTPQRRFDIQNIYEFRCHGYNFKCVMSVSEFMNDLKNHPVDNRILLSRTITSLNWVLFSPDVQNLLHRTVVSIWDNSDNYLGYFVFDIKEESPSQRYLLVRQIELLETDIYILKALKKYLKVVARQNGCFMVQIRIIMPDLKLDKMLRKVIRLKKEGVNNYLVKLSKNIELSLDEFRASALDPDLGFV